MKDIQSYFANYDVPSSGFSFGKFRDNPGDDTGSALTADLFNDLLYAFYAFINKYGDVSDTDESESASDFVDAFEAVTVRLTGNQTVAGVKTFSDGVDGIKDQGSAGAVIHKRIIEIGDWNMDTTLSVNIAHGLTMSKIRNVHALIRNDADTIYTMFPGYITASGSFIDKISLSSTEITLFRAPSSEFDSTDFDSTSYNRGWITIEYVD